MSAGVSGSSGASSSRNVPKWALPAFKDLFPLVQQQEAAYDPSGGAPTAAARGEIMNTLSGSMADPNNNPQLQAVIKSLGEQTSNEWNNQIAPAITNQAEQAGSLYSTQAQKALGEAATNVQDSYANTIANLEYGNQQSERQNQIAAAGQALGLNTDQLNQLLAVLGSFTGISQQNRSSNFGWNAGVSYG